MPPYARLDEGPTPRTSLEGGIGLDLDSGSLATEANYNRAHDHDRLPRTEYSDDTSDDDSQSDIVIYRDALDVEPFDEKRSSSLVRHRAGQDDRWEEEGEMEDGLEGYTEPRRVSVGFWMRWTLIKAIRAHRFSYDPENDPNAF